MICKPEYPDFKQITKLCKEKIKEKFPQYGNSWNDLFIKDSFWMKRLQGEIDEIWKAENSCQQKKEIIDAINILSMMFDAVDHKCKEEDGIYQRTWRYG